MKKISALFIIALAMVFFAVSCQKEDGVFNPKQKITKVYDTYSSTDEEYINGSWQTTETYQYGEELCQEWEWNGDLLESITYYSNGIATDKENFTYDAKNRLISVQSDRQACSIIYEKDKISSIDQMYDGEYIATFKVTYDGKHISQLEYISFGIDLNKAIPTSLLRQILPSAEPATIEQIAAHMKTSLAKKDGFNEIIKLEWKGNNISKISEEYAGMTYYSVDYTYDNKINPFKGFLNFLELEPSEFSSKNNVTSQIAYLSGQKESEYNYTYTYTGKYPETKSYSYTLDYSDDTRSTSTHKYRYEYR